MYIHKHVDKSSGKKIIIIPLKKLSRIRLKRKPWTQQYMGQGGGAGGELWKVEVAQGVFLK